MSLSQAFSCMSTNEQTFSFWLIVNAFCVIIGAQLFFIIATLYIGKSIYFKHISVLVLIIMETCLLSVLFFRTNGVFNYTWKDSILTPWGRMPQLGPYNTVVGGIVLLITGISTFLLFHYYFKTQNAVKRQQILLPLIGFLILGIGAPIFQGILPNALHMQVLPMAVILQAIQNILIAYSLGKYGISTFNITTISEQLFTLIPSAVIVINDKQAIQLVNPSAEALLQADKTKLIGKSIQTLFSENNDYIQLLSMQAENKQFQLHDSQITSLLGQHIAVDINAAEIRDPESGITETLLILTSIQTIKNQAEELKQKFQDVEKQKSELERMNTLMVNRELRIIELKKQVEELKKTIPT